MSVTIEYERPSSPQLSTLSFTRYSSLLALNLAVSVTLKLSRSDCYFSPLAATNFFVNTLQEFGVRSR